VISMSDPLDTLLVRLDSGDEAAAEQTFRTCEPYLRMVVRRQLPAWLRPQFDSIDIVPSVWVDVLEGFRLDNGHFATAGQLRAFLIEATRNRFLDDFRQVGRRQEQEKPLEGLPSTAAPSARQPHFNEETQANERWEQLLALCPPAHQQLLQLERQGATPTEIATQTGLHESSVRRILYDLARRLADRQQAEALPPVPPGKLENNPHA